MCLCKCNHLVSTQFIWGNMFAWNYILWIDQLFKGMGPRSPFMIFGYKFNTYSGMQTTIFCQFKDELNQSGNICMLDYQVSEINFIILNYPLYGAWHSSALFFSIKNKFKIKLILWISIKFVVYSKFKFPSIYNLITRYIKITWWQLGKRQLLQVF